MTTTLLIRTFRQLSPKDLRALREWVRCGVFNRREDVALLGEYLCDNINKVTAKELSAEALWKAACPGKALKVKQLRHIMSFLLATVRQYLAWSEWQSDEADVQRYLLRSLGTRHLDQLFEKAWEQGRDQVEQQPVRDAQYHFSRYMLQQEQIKYSAGSSSDVKEELPSMPDELTTFYISEMLRNACLTHTNQAVSGQEFRLDLLQVVIKTAGRQEMLQIPAVAVYYHAYQMLQAPTDDDPYERLKNTLNKFQHRFSATELRSLYYILINACIRRVNAGRRSFIREAFELYKAGLEKDVFLENNMLSGHTYKNIIRVAVSYGDYAWAEKFLEQYKSKIHPKERESLYRLNLAFLRFRQKDFSQALPLLKKLNLEDVTSNLEVRRMLLQTYYETNDTTSLAPLLDSFSTYLQKQKNLGHHQTSHENLIHFTRKLIEADTSNRLAMNMLYKEIENRSDVMEKSWLLEQLRAYA
ncbi:MAG: hypothetical protein R3A50_14810 [Saprospiraceae bacterium]